MGFKHLHIALLACATVVVGCGSGPIVLDVDLPTNQASPFPDLIANNGGVFFQFDPLVANPSNIDDVMMGAPSITFPASLPLLPPDSLNYELTEVNLESSTRYRVLMFGTLDSTNMTTPKYEATGDCPLQLDLKDRNLIHLCLGLTSTNPLCVEQTPFSQCP